MEKVGKIIRERRRELGLTQSDLGDKLNCCSLTVSHLESGKSVGTKLLGDICKILGLELSVKLINNEEESAII